MWIIGIDIGNTNITMGLFRQDTLIDNWRFISTPQKTADEWTLLIAQQLQQTGVERKDVEGVIISSVVPALNEIFNRVAVKLFRKEPLFVNASLDLGIIIDYDPPSSVGAEGCQGLAIESS